MSTPWQPGPDGAWQYGSRFGQDLDEATVKSQITGQPKSNIDNSILGWDGAVSDLAGLSATVTDGQLSMNGRLTELEGVAGLGSLWMSQNWTLPGGARKVLPFDSWYGPNTPNVTRLGRGLRLGGYGLWTAFPHITFFPPQNTWLTTGLIQAQVWLVVRRNFAAIPWTELQYDVTITSVGPETAAFSKSFVIPDDGATYSVEVEIQHPNTGAKVYGGTQRSRLTVHRWSTGTDNAANEPTVQDGGTLA